MARVVVDERAIEAFFFQQMIEGFDDIGLEVKRFVQRNTPVRTGFAQRSVWYAVIDERGNVVGGDTQDGNGQSIGNYLPGARTGSIHVIVAANADYYIWIEIGARGRPGRQALARGAELLDQRMRQWYAEHRR